MIPVSLAVRFSEGVDTPTKRLVLSEFEGLGADLAKHSDIFLAERDYNPTLSFGALEIVVLVASIAVAVPVSEFLAKKLGVDSAFHLLRELIVKRQATLEVSSGSETVRLALEEGMPDLERVKRLGEGLKKIIEANDTQD